MIWLSIRKIQNYIKVLETEREITNERRYSFSSDTSK